MIVHYCAATSRDRNCQRLVQLRTFEWIVDGGQMVTPDGPASWQLSFVDFVSCHYSTGFQFSDGGPHSSKQCSLYCINLIQNFVYYIKKILGITLYFAEWPLNERTSLSATYCVCLHVHDIRKWRVVTLLVYLCSGIKTPRFTLILGHPV
jgi:hypothetical protein